VLSVKAKKKKNSLQPEVVLDSQDFFVVNKPPGMVVNNAVTVADNLTLQSWLTKFDFPLAHDGSNRNGIVHRLDKDTSGLVIVAKNLSIMKAIQAQFKSRLVQKSYVALVHGKTPTKGDIDAPIARSSFNRERFTVTPRGKPSQTSFELVNYYKDSSNNFYSLLNLYPKTGRTHQLRVHLKYLGYPIVSDPFYAGGKITLRDKAWCPRLFLHAAKISFTDPKSKKLVTVQSDLPQDLSDALNCLICHHEKGQD